MEASVSSDTTELVPHLLLYCVLILIAVLARAVVYFVIQPGRGTSVPRLLDPHDVAMLIGGSARVTETALAGLVESGAVSFDPGAAVEFRPRPQVRPPGDAVQRQVLGLLPGCPDGHRLRSAFNRSEAAGRLRGRLTAAGLMTDRRRYAAVTSFVRAYFWLIPPVVSVVPWENSAEVPLLVLSMAAFGHCFLALACHFLLPLTLSREGNRLYHAVDEVLRKHHTGELASGSDTVLQRTRADLSALAEKWHFEPGLLDSANGLVPFVGWAAYRDKWGRYLAPRKFWLWTRSAGRVPGMRRRLGLVYRALGAACGLAAIPLGLLLASQGQVWGLLLIVILPPAGAAMATRGRKHRVRPGYDRSRTAFRPPVLYLRPFTHDARLEAPKLRGVRAALGFRTSYIEELVRVLYPFGDLVAIGDPGAALPGLGPAQIFVPPATGPGTSAGALDRWQAEVLGLMHDSSLVVIAAGLGDGLLWEFRQATARVPPQKLVVLVPLGRADYALFRKYTGALFRAGLPDDTRRPEKKKTEPAHGLIYFDHDWTPHFVRFGPHPLAQLHLGRIATRPSLRRLRNQITHALYPVFHRNRVSWPGIEIPVPFTGGVRHRVLRGLSLRSVIVLVIGIQIVRGMLPS